VQLPILRTFGKIRILGGRPKWICGRELISVAERERDLDDVCDVKRVIERGGDGGCLFSLECTGDSCIESAGWMVESTGEATGEGVNPE
jgi:hypothetical protein